MTTTIIPERLKKVEKIPLLKGGHEPPNGEFQACVMEAVSFVAGEPWSDNPECASKVIGAFMRSWNDSLGDEDRQRLKPYITKLVGTAAPREVEERRAWMALDWLVRAQAVAWLRLAKLEKEAAAIEALPEITDPETARAAQPTLEAGRHAARAAAGAAARAAAGAAARAAAGDALEPTKVELQASAHLLFDRMIDGPFDQFEAAP